MIAIKRGRILSGCLYGLIWFSLAFLFDRATDQRLSSIWGSLAILATILSVFPRIHLATWDLGLFGLVWMSFALVRAISETAGLAIVDRLAVNDAETALFGASLPSTRLQVWFSSRPGHEWWELALGLVYVSFFVTPFLTGVLLWRKQRALFRAGYLPATALMLALGLAGFLLAPTAPPWMADPGHVSRLARSLAPTGSAGSRIGADSPRNSAFWFEPNNLAAFPSIHVAAIVLAVLAWYALRPSTATRWLGLVYAGLMTLAVVYLGEHYLLDAIGGWMIAWTSWLLVNQLAGRRRRAASITR